MRPLPLLVPLALLVAGCVGDPAQTASLDPLDPLTPQRLADVVSVVDPEGGHGEPSFGVTADGILFANGEGGRGGGVFRSDDGGATWTRVATPVEPMPNFDPDLVVDKDGTVWFSALWIGCTSVAVSRDLGETWTFNPVSCNAPVSDRQYVVPTEDGTAYLYSHQLPTFWQMAAKTTDYGATWVPTAPVEPVTTNLLVNEGSGWGGGGVWNEATGSVSFSWTQSRDGVLGAGGWAPAAAVTRDGGASWEIGSASSMGGKRLGLGLVVGAADDAGNTYLAWGETLGETTAIYLAASIDDGRTWNAPVRVDATEGSKVFPAITAGPAGKVAVAYYEADEAAYPSDVEGEWRVTLAWTDDALAPQPRFRHGMLSDGVVKKGGICIDGTTCDGDREFLDYFQAHRLPDGRVGAIFNAIVGGKTVEVYAATRDALLA